MKRTLITIIITTVITALIVLTIFEIKAQMNQMDADRVEEIDSEILGEKRKVLIHLPRNYNPNQAYPILYVLDGSSQDFRMAALAEILNIAEVVPEMLIVGIPNTDRNRDLTPHYILENTEGEIFGRGNHFLDFIELEVIPFIENKYPSDGSRMLAGHSRGGLFTFYAYMEKPQLFDSYFCFSPAFWRDDSIIIDKVKGFKPEDSDSPFIFMSLGTNENSKMKNAYDQMTSLLANSSSYTNFIHTYTTDADHGNNLYYSTPLALKRWSDHVQK